MSNASAMAPPARPRLSEKALDFAPGLLAIQESPPSRMPRAVMYTIATLLALMLLWAAIGHLDIVASAEGKLIPKTYLKLVQPADAGIVKEILVHEGERVKAGQVLLRLDAQDAQADASRIGTDLALRSLQLRRIDARQATLLTCIGKSRRSIAIVIKLTLIPWARSKNSSKNHSAIMKRARPCLASCSKLTRF